MFVFIWGCIVLDVHVSENFWECHEHDVDQRHLLLTGNFFCEGSKLCWEFEMPRIKNRDLKGDCTESDDERYEGDPFQQVEFFFSCSICIFSEINHRLLLVRTHILLRVPLLDRVLLLLEEHRRRALLLPPRRRQPLFFLYFFWFWRVPC